MAIPRPTTATNRMSHLSITAAASVEPVDFHTAFFGSACFINPHDRCFLDYAFWPLAASDSRFDQVVYRFDCTRKEAQDKAGVSTLRVRMWVCTSNYERLEICPPLKLPGKSS